MEQQTLADSFTLSGMGIHTGTAGQVTVYPAPADSGRVFRIGKTLVPARAVNVVDTRRCTTLGVGDARVMTVEHLLAALMACGIDNALIEVEGPEIPILDGSALPFMDAIQAVGGARRQGREAHTVRADRSVRLESGSSRVHVEPADDLTVTVGVEFDEWPEGDAEITLKIEEETWQTFRDEIAPARTFAFRKEVEMLLAAGLAKGGSLDNALIITPPDLFSSPLRLPSEWARHKLLDVIGDLALIDARPEMSVNITRPGHRINTMAAHALLV